jgi:hypothetical protein
MSTRPGVAHFQLFTADSRGLIRWRLLSGNNREIGRSTAVFADAESAQLAIKGFVESIDAFSEQVRRLDGRGWGWTLMSADGPIAASSRPYDRQVRCEQALLNFCELARCADLGGAVVVSASRMWSHTGQGRHPMLLNSGVDHRRPLRRSAS